MAEVETEKVLRAVTLIAQKHRLPPGFIPQLRGEAEDWALVLKLQALLEASLIERLAAELDPRIGKRLRRLRHSDAIRWAKDLDLIYPKALSFLTALNELRNETVHSVENVALRLETGEPLAGQALAKWSNCIKATAALLFETEADVTANAKESLWLASVSVLSLLEGGEPLRLIDESMA